MRKVNQTIVKLGTDEMTINFDVLGSFMKNRVPGNVQSILIITEDRNGKRNSETKIRQ